MTIATNLFHLGREQALTLWKRLMVVILGMFGLITVMWLLNIAGLQGVNLALYFIGVIATIGIYLTPRAFFYALGGGVIVAELRDEDLSQGSVKGLVALYRAGIWTLLGFCIMAGGLATWSFESSPGAFWVFAAASFTLVIAMAAFKLKGTWLAFIVLAYTVFVILSALAATVTGNSPSPHRVITDIYQGKATTERAEKEARKTQAAAKNAVASAKRPGSQGSVIQAPNDLRVLCQETSRSCKFSPATEYLQQINVERKSGVCIGYHFEPTGQVETIVSDTTVTFVVPPRTNFWSFYLLKGEQFRNRPRC